MKRKLTALFLAGILALGGTLLLASCTNPPLTTTTTATTTAVIPNVPQKIPSNIHFKGEEYDDEDRIVTVAYLNDNLGSYTRRSLKADLLNEADVDVATRARDGVLKKQFGLELQLIGYDPHSYGSNAGTATLESISIAICSGICDYDLIVSKPSAAAKLTQTGYLLNLAEANDYLPNDWKVLDLNASYWSQAYNDAMSYRGAYFWITGDFTLRYSGSMYATFVNERLYTDNLRSTYGELTTIAKDGDWTIDRMTEMITTLQSAAPDANGLVYENNEMLTAIIIGMGNEFTVTDSQTGEVHLTVLSQRTLNSADEIRTLVGQTSAKQFAYDYTDPSIKEFAKSNSLFAVNTLLSAERYLADMTDRYMVLPMPKYDANDEYLTLVSESANIFAVPATSQKIPQAVVALEFLCAYNQENVIPLFFQSVLKGQYTRDVDQAAIMDMIHENAYGNFASIWSENVGLIGSFFYDPSNVNKSQLQRKLNDWKTQLDTFTDQYENAIEGYQIQREKILGTDS